MFDAEKSMTESVPLAELPSKAVTVQPGWAVSDVLSAAGFGGASSFALTTSQLEADAAWGQSRTVAAAYNLLGLTPEGEINFAQGFMTPWEQFTRAVDAGLFAGAYDRIAVYPYGAAGGFTPDGLVDMVLWLFDNRDAVLASLTEYGGGAATIWGSVKATKITRRKAIAKKWRKQGSTADRIADILSRFPQWDAAEFAERMAITELEAQLALANAGWVKSQDDLWRPGRTDEAEERRQGIEAARHQARVGGAGGAQSHGDLDAAFDELDHLDEPS